jgi:soluble lytic murein transglycosylase-like protein
MKKIKYLAALLFLVPSITVQANSLNPVDEETPIEIQIACNKYGAKYGICPELLEAIAKKESRFQEDVIDSTQSCYGLMQIKQSCHKERMKKLGVTNLLDIDSNVLVASDYLSELFEQYEDVGTVLMIYHGEKNAIKKGESGKLSEYASEILETSRYLEVKHGK